MRLTSFVFNKDSQGALAMNSARCEPRPANAIIFQSSACLERYYPPSFAWTFSGAYSTGYGCDTNLALRQGWS